MNEKNLYKWAYVELREAEVQSVIEHIRGTSSFDDRETTAAMLRRVADSMRNGVMYWVAHDSDTAIELRVAAEKLEIAEARVKEWQKQCKFKPAQ